MFDLKSLNQYHVLGGILLLAAVLRIWGLNAPLWFDEIVTLDSHVRLPWGEMMQSYSMNHHYLFSLQSKVFVSIFGESAWALRMPAMLFGVGSIAAIWWLARDLSDKWIAHLTALLLAISFHHIWFSQNARGYTELAFWSSLGMIFFMNGLRSPSWKTWAGYALCLFFAVATHLTGAFFFIAQGLVWLSLALPRVFKDGIKSDFVIMPTVGYLAGGALILLFYAPVFGSLVESVGGVTDTSAGDVMQEYQNPIWTVIEGVRTAVGSLGPIVGLIALAVLTLVALGSYDLRNKSRVFPITIGLHILVTIALLMALNMRIWPRFFFVDIGFLMLLIVLGVRFSIQIFTRYVSLVPARTLFTAAAAAMVLISGVMAARNYTAPKQNLIGAYTFAETERSGGAEVFAVGVASDLYLGFFGADWGVVMDDEDYAAAAATEGAQVYVVALPDRSFRMVPELYTQWQAEELDLIKVFPGTLGDGYVLVLRRG